MVLPEIVRKYPKLREWFTTPFVKDINQDALTWISFLIAIFAGYLFSQDLLLYGSIAVALSAYLDVLDGDIARKFKRASKFGDFLDHSLDRLSDLAILIGIGLSSFVDLNLALGTYIAVLLVSYMGTQAHALTEKRLYDGLLGRGDRMALFFIGGVLSSYTPYLINYFVWAMLILSIITFMQRFAAVWGLLKQNIKKS